MLTFRPQGGTNLSREGRSLADAYLNGATPGGLPAQVVRAVYGSRGPITGRQLKQQTGYRADELKGFRTAAECARLAASLFPTPAPVALPAWLADEPEWPQMPAWLTSPRTAR